MGMDMEGSGSGMDSDSEDGDLEESESEGWDQIDMDYQKTQPDQLTIEELHQQLEHAEPNVETADSLAKGLESLIEQGGVENFYIEIPKIDLDKVIISNKAIHKICAENWKGYEGKRPYRYDVTEEEIENLTVFSEVDLEYKKFKKSAQKEVNYLVKEFECKKAADSYARSTVSRTGVLNTSKPVSYTPLTLPTILLV